jgi:hypothetical protein
MPPNGRIRKLCQQWWDTNISFQKNLYQNPKECYNYSAALFACVGLSESDSERFNMYQYFR